jgi:hypothetical protein
VPGLVTQLRQSLGHQKIHNSSRSLKQTRAAHKRAEEEYIYCKLALSLRTPFSKYAKRFVECAQKKIINIRLMLALSPRNRVTIVGSCYQIFIPLIKNETLTIKDHKGFTIKESCGAAENCICVITSWRSAVSVSTPRKCTEFPPQ